MCSLASFALVLFINPATGYAPAADACRHPLLAWRRTCILDCVLPGGGDTPQRAALDSLLRRAGFKKEPRRVEELSAGFCNWVYLCEVDENGDVQNATAEGVDSGVFAAAQSEVEGEGHATGEQGEQGLAGQSADAVAFATEPMGPRQRVAFVVAKLFSPLAKLRLTPAMRGAADARAAAHGLGPRLLFSSDEGLITDFVRGRTLTESDIHESKATKGILKKLAPRLAALHSVPLQGHPMQQQPAVLWHFMAKMLAQIERGEAALPEGITVQQVRKEVRRMRERFEELQLPVVHGHGDLKPSNVMQREIADGLGFREECPDVTFIDFELSGPHYRGYDLYKLFRTSPGQLSRKNMRAFLRDYLSCIRDRRRPALGIGSLKRRAQAVAELNELHAETLAFEPLTWLEAAVFFFFAMATYPARAHDWEPLALDRWHNYLASAHLVEADGQATRNLVAARAAKAATTARHGRRRGNPPIAAVSAA